MMASIKSSTSANTASSGQPQESDNNRTGGASGSSKISEYQNKISSLK